MTLTIAVPSKGRMKEDTLARFAAAGLPIAPPSDRSYQSQIEGRNDLTVLFLSASEIARELARGTVHLGVTGEDLARESVANADGAMDFLVPLGFGKADVVVAVPAAWVDVETMADLDDVAATFRARTGRRLRVATKYWRLTQSFFASHGVAVYRIVESLGATEGAPAAGSADAIVDITSTGSTIRANALKILKDGVILQSQATLTAAKGAAWDETRRAQVDEVTARLRV
jgi:ATP phosphoribosyltransferase